MIETRSMYVSTALEIKIEFNFKEELLMLEKSKVI